MINFPAHQHRIDVIFSCQDRPFVGTPPEVRRHLANLFSIYANFGAINTGYLMAVTEEEMAMIVERHEMAMADLTAEQQMLIKDLLSRRYLNAMDRQATALIREGRISQYRSESQIMDGKISAIEADLAELETLRQQVSLAVDRAGVRIKELESQLKEAQVQAQFVVAEVAQKKLDRVKAELSVLQAQQRAVQYQIEVVELGLELARIPAELANLKADTAEYQAKITMLESERVQLSAETTQLQTRYARVSVDIVESQAKKAQSDFQLAGIATRVKEFEAEEASLSSKIDTVNARIQSIDANIAELKAKKEEVGARIAELEYEIAKTQVDGAQYRVRAQEALLVESTVRETAAVVSEYTAELGVMDDKYNALTSKLRAIEQQEGMYDRLLQYESQVADSLSEYLLNKANAEAEQLDSEATVVRTHSAAQRQLFASRARAAEQDSDAEIDSAEEHAKVFDARLAGAEKTAQGRIDAATMTAMAKVQYTVNHSMIGKK